MTKNELRTFLTTTLSLKLTALVENIVDDLNEEKDLTLVDLGDEVEREDLVEEVNLKIATYAKGFLEITEKDTVAFLTQR